jgi:hypothetical protein
MFYLFGFLLLLHTRNTFLSALSGKGEWRSPQRQNRLSQLPVPSHYLAIELSCNGMRTRFSSLPIPYPTYQLVRRRLVHRSPPGTLVSLPGSFFDMSAFAAFAEAVAFFADTLHATPRHAAPADVPDQPSTYHHHSSGSLIGVSML